MDNSMTPAQLQEEWNYRFKERLGILCGAAEPSAIDLALAKKEADYWLANYAKTTQTHPARSPD